MTLVAKNKKMEEKIFQKDITEVYRIIISSFYEDLRKRKTNPKAVVSERLIDKYKLFLVALLENDLLRDKKDKLEIIKFIDKLNSQKEALEIKSGKKSFEELSAASKRLGRKSQSAFSSKL